GERPQVRPARGARRFGRRDARRALRGRAREGARAQAAAGNAARVLGRDGRAPVVHQPETERSYAASVTTAYIGLGSNLGDRESTILAAAERLGPHRLSPIVETEPWGYADQPKFLNAVAEVETALGARALLDFLLEIERELGRVRDGPRYGPRSIDLDLLLFGDEVIDEPGLTVPHPRMAERLFVLEPLLALNPGLFVPGQGALEALVAGLQST